MTSIIDKPPSPPNEEVFGTEITVLEKINKISIPCKFKYIKDKNYRIMLNNAWQAITLTKMWDFVKNQIESFMFSSDPRVNIIYVKMEELGYYGHSGCSFGRIMRIMQYIAKYGEEIFKKSCVN
jgi:hypothetical protein